MLYSGTAYIHSYAKWHLKNCNDNNVSQVWILTLPWSSQHHPNTKRCEGVLRWIHTQMFTASTNAASLLFEVALSFFTSIDTLSGEQVNHVTPLIHLTCCLHHKKRSTTIDLCIILMLIHIPSFILYDWPYPRMSYLSSSDVLSAGVARDILIVPFHDAFCIFYLLGFKHVTTFAYHWETPFMETKLNMKHESLIQHG